MSRHDTETDGGILLEYRDIRSYRFRIDRDWSFDTGITGVLRRTAESGPGSDGRAFVALRPDGLLRLRAGYSWDGPTFYPGHPRRLVRGSLVHDALYQLIRDEHFGSMRREVAERADRLMLQIFLEDGTPQRHARRLYRTVRRFGRCYELPCSRPEPPRFRVRRTVNGNKVEAIHQPGDCPQWADTLAGLRANGCADAADGELVPKDWPRPGPDSGQD